MIKTFSSIAIPLLSSDSLSLFSLGQMSYYDPPPPAPWVLTWVPILVSAVPLFLTVFLRRISALTRTGLWLLPWLPVWTAVVFTWSHVDSSILIQHCWGP